MRAWMWVPLIALTATLLGGCAVDSEWYRRGLQYHLDSEAHKKMLNDMGFPQYNFE